MKSDLSKSHNSVSKPIARRRVGPRGLLSGAARAARSGSRRKSQISVSKTGADFDPGGGDAPACGMSFGIDPLLRRSVYTSTWTRSRLIGEARLLAMAIVDNSPYNHQPGVADPSGDLGSVGRRPLSETASPEPRPPPASHQPPSLQHLTPPPPQNHPSPQTPFTRFGNFPNHPQPLPNQPLPFAPPNRHTFSARPPC